MTDQAELERQVREAEQARGYYEAAAQAMLAAAAAEWLKHYSLTPDAPEGPTSEIVTAMLVRQAARATRAASRALWPSVARSTGTHAAADVPRTPRVELAAARTASAWARDHARREVKTRRAAAKDVESPAGVELPPQRSSSMQPQSVPRQSTDDWARAAARSLAVRSISELTEELKRDAPSPIGGKLHRVWITRGDHRVRDSHRDLHGQSRAGTAPFKKFGSQVLAFPGDPRAPLDETIGCRCVLAYSVGPIGNAIGPFPEVDDEGEPLAASALVAAVSLEKDPALLPHPFHSHGDSAFMAALPRDPEILSMTHVGDVLDDDADLSEPRWLAPEELHVTVGYVGKNDSAEVGPDAYHAIDECCCSLGPRYAPIKATVTGVDVFGHDGEKAVVLLLDAPPLHQIHDELTHCLEQRDSLTEAYMRYPSYTPHMTVGYGMDPDDPRVQAMIGSDVFLDRVVSTWKQMPPRHYMLGSGPDR